MRRGHIVGLVIALAFVCAPIATWAQGVNSSITGVARDTSGGVFPGVTVEAASPALIDKVRTAVTDAKACTGSWICGPATTP